MGRFFFESEPLTIELKIISVNINYKFSPKSKKQNPLFIRGFCSVESTDIFSNSFREDLEVLSALRLHISDGTKA